MGFSYASWGLCCDLCSRQSLAFRDGNTPEPARKIDCPYGFCQAWAVCKSCEREGKYLEYASTFLNLRDKRHHDGCRRQMEMVH